MEEPIKLKVSCVKDHWQAYGGGGTDESVTEQVAKVGPFPQKYFPALCIKEIHEDRIVIADEKYERVLTPHECVRFHYSIEGREWSDGCVCDGTDYDVTITWE
ncbi:MAG: hypothetical protein ACI3YM_03805 [Prevotella sp.]